MAFPQDLDTNTTIPVESSSTPLSTNHVANHSASRDALIALESKVGINGSLVVTTHDYKLSEVTGTDKAVSKTATQTLTNKTLNSPIISVGSDATGDTYFRNSAGVLERIPLGTNGQVLTSNGTSPVFTSPNTSTNFLYVNDTGVANAYVAILVPAITSYSAGQLVQFKALNTNTGASTVNVNGLGVKTILKGNGSTNLAAGDIVAGQVVELEYDGVNFQMMSPVGNPPITLIPILRASNGVLNLSVTGTTTITTGFTSRNIQITAVAGGGSSNTIPAQSNGVYSATSNNQNCTFVSFDGNGANGLSGIVENILYIGFGVNFTPSTAIVNNITATSFDIVFTKGSSNANLVWSARE